MKVIILIFISICSLKSFAGDNNDDQFIQQFLTDIDRESHLLKKAIIISKFLEENLSKDYNINKIKAVLNLDVVINIINNPSSQWPKDQVKRLFKETITHHPEYFFWFLENYVDQIESIENKNAYIKEVFKEAWKICPLEIISKLYTYNIFFNDDDLQYLFFQAAILNLEDERMKKLEFLLEKFNIASMNREILNGLIIMLKSSNNNDVIILILKNLTNQNYNF